MILSVPLVNSQHRNDQIVGENQVPLVSIVTPSFEQGEFIQDTILSVKNQQYPNLEHIIIDGGSTDATVEILRRFEGTYQMSWVSEPDGGQAEAVNKGLDQVKGVIIGWLNSDDVYLHSRVVEEVVKWFEISGSDIIYGDDALIDGHGNISRIRIFPRFNYARLLRYGGISQPAVFFRRSVMADQRLRTDLDFAMDTELWLRLGKSYHFSHINKVLAGNRIHPRRKMVVHKIDAHKERLAVSAAYGLRQRRWAAVYSLLMDKSLTGLLRVHGLQLLLRMRFTANSVFPFIHPPRRLTSAVKAQLIGKF